MKKMLLATIAALALTASSAGAMSKELKASLFLPPAHTWAKELKALGQELSEKSNGELTLTLFPAGQLGPVNKQMDLVRAGVADISVVLHGAYPGRFDLTEVAQLPFALPSGEHGAEAGSVALTEAREMTANEYKGLKILYLAASPTTGIFWKDKEVRNPADFAGKRLRGGGKIANAVLEAWGASAVTVATPEITDSIQKGVINGTSFNFEASASYRLEDVVKYVTPVTFTVASFAVVMNQKTYDSLSPKLRKIIDESTGVEAARRVGKAFDEGEAHGREVFKAAGVNILDLNDGERGALEDVAKGVAEKFLAEKDAAGLPAHEFYAKLKASVSQ